MLEALVERDRCRSLWSAHALMALEPDAQRVAEIAHRGLEDMASGPLGSLKAGPFQILPAMLLYCRWEAQLPLAAREDIEAFMTRGLLERGNTENHWLMYYAGNLLAAECWPDLETNWNGLPPEAMRREATRWILGTIERTARLGHHEYDSPQYHIEHMVSLIGLYEHARDGHLRRQVEQVLALLVADMALEYFRGSWAGGHSREGYRQNTWTRVGPIQSLQYLYFGGEEFDPDMHLHDFAVPVLVAAYRPPALLEEMAWDREQPHVVKKTKAPRNIFRHAERDAGAVRKYTYMSRSFALGSTQVNLPGAPAGPIDLVSWDLTWNGPRHQAKIGCNHPYRSPRRFSAFLSGLPQDIGRSVATGKPYLQFPDRLFGASPFERMMQHEGALIVLYRIPPDDKTPYVNLFLPRDTAWKERAGWLMGDMGDFYVALFAIGPYHWLEICEATHSNTMVGTGDLVAGWLLRLDEVNTGLAVEAVEAEEAGDFDGFCAARAACPPDLSGWPESGRVALETRAGRRLEMTYDGEHCIDGEAIDYDAYPLYEALGVEAPLGSGRMCFRRGDAVFELDFGVDPEAPLMPMRVIG